jgi:hypothetical protein
VHGYAARKVYPSEILGLRQGTMENLGLRLKGMDSILQNYFDRIYRIIRISFLVRSPDENGQTQSPAANNNGNHTYKFK